MDVDGTLTDGNIYMGRSGEAFKTFDIKDGCGIKDILPRIGIVAVIITARNSVMLKNRCDELGIVELHQGVRNKREKLDEILNKYSTLDLKYTLQDCAYIGDDILDLQCMNPIKEAGGLTACPYDAVDDVKAVVNYICKRKGGEGAVRDFIEWLVKKNNKEQLSKKVDAAIELVKQQDINALPVGRYELTDGSYYMVQEYITKKEHHCKLESHKKYIDVQWVLKGKEKIKTYSVDKLDPETSYDFEKDVVFWKPVDDMMNMQLCDGSYIVLYPGDAHMPCIMSGEQDTVRKIVIKVKI